MAQKALTAAHVAAEFGSTAPCAQRVIRTLQASEVPGDTLDPTRAYYALLLKLLAAHALGGLSGGRTLHETLSRIEGGSLFRESGIANFPGDLGGAKYLRARNGELESALGEIVRRLRERAPPQKPQDLVKDLYLSLFSRESRHDRGEYYTPDWLAERLLSNTLESDLGNPEKRVLDPACGSGTFLVLLIRHIRERAASLHLNPRHVLRLILRNVVGFDVNPLAVLAARTNFLLALGDLVAFREGEFEIPVHVADAALTPLAADQFDYVVGNPPWVNWQSLSEEYRHALFPLWQQYGLFPKRAKAMHTILGGAKYDLSMLLTYSAADRYLQPKGRVGFLVSQSLFKSAGAGQGFRRFQLPDGTPLAPLLVEDFVELQPFESAVNRTAAVVLQKGEAIRYPVTYQRHNRRTGEHLSWEARPVSAEDPSSAWICAPPAALAVITQILGASPYLAREGANTGGANGVFWLEVTGAAACGRLPVRNLTEGARKPVRVTRARVESELIYPLLRGQNVSRWRAEPVNWILLTHRSGMKLRAISEREMRDTYPGAFSYLRGFQDLLSARPAFKRYFKSDAPFYSLFNLGDYTFAPWKVVWREQARLFTAAVAGRAAGRLVIPDHKLMLVPAASSREAHYLCAVLNSLPVSAAVAAYAVEVQISTHVLEYIRVPQFNGADPLHRALSSWSRKAHAAGRKRNRAAVQTAEAAIDRCAASLWELSEADLAEMRRFLREAGGAPAPT